MIPSLAGARICVDVQHLYRPDHPRDRGTIFELVNGTHIAEADAATLYAAALVATLAGWGAATLTNEPAHGILVGSYGERNRAASAWGANAYLACHLNAGGGRYARVESLASAGLETARLVDRVLKPLANTVPEVVTYQRHALALGERGRICIEGSPCPMPAVILEPFFGDTPSQQVLLAAPRLAEVGRALAYGVADWWAERQTAPLPA